MKNNKYNILIIFIANFLFFIDLFFGIYYIDHCNYDVNTSGFYIVNVSFITSSGTYCINISVSDVILDGNGSVIDAMENIGILIENFTRFNI
jgi:hypothetical protein